MVCADPAPWLAARITYLCYPPPALHRVEPASRLNFEIFLSSSALFSGKLLVAATL